MGSGTSISSMIGFSWAKSKELLFPFRFKRWFKILIIVWLAAAGIQGCSLNFKMPGKPASPAATTLPAGTPQTIAPRIPGTIEAPAALHGAPQRRDVDTRFDRIKKMLAGEDLSPAMESRRKAQRPKPDHRILLGITGGLFLLFAGFVVLGVWLNCRFSFVLWETLATREVSIQKTFREQRENGDSYFKWSLVFLAAGFTALMVVGAATAGLWVVAKGHSTAQAILGLTGGFLFVTLFAGLIFTGWVARDFVSPIVYREKIPMTEAWGKFLDAQTFSFGAIGKYILVVMGLAALAMIVQAIVGLIALIGGVVAGGMIAIPGILLFKAVAFLKLPLLVLGVLLGLALIFAVGAVIGMVMLPVSVFFRMFALTYLTRLYPDCDLLNFEA